MSAYPMPFDKTPPPEELLPYKKIVWHMLADGELTDEQIPDLNEFALVLWRMANIRLYAAGCFMAGILGLNKIQEDAA